MSSTFIKRKLNMRELNSAEVMKVSGGGDIDPMDYAIGYSSSMVSLFVGLSVAGPIGGIVGAVGGFAIGSIMNIGYSLASGGSGRTYYDDGESCRIVR
jgi:hypothetical protein